ncbi:hypothetical protein BKA60DRAFT_529220 [Fusarium oxysporum]|nr:hypothetical protein BKA60DRAFT_529220 [Fusarium oxysporum]
MAGHALMTMSSTSGPLPSMELPLSPVSAPSSDIVARSEHVIGRAPGRESIAESVKLPGVFQMLQGDAPDTLRSRQNPTLSPMPFQPHRLRDFPVIRRIR